MDEQKKPRAWVYARIPGDYDGTMNSFKVCSMQALRDGCDIVGGSTDEHGGWLLRPGYREMMQQVKVGNVDCIYICRMRQVSGKERHLYSFFRRLMQHGVQITATEYSQGHYGRPKKRPNPPSIRQQLVDAREESFGY